jgi:hypothetical protein
MFECPSCFSLAIRMCTPIVLFALCVGLINHAVSAQGFGRKRDIYPAIQEDIEYLRCSFCKLAAKQLHEGTGRLRAALPSWQKTLSEGAIIDFIEDSCKPEKEAGEWLTKLDVQQQGSALVIKEMSKVLPYLMTHSTMHIHVSCEAIA